MTSFAGGKAYFRAPFGGEAHTEGWTKDNSAFIGSGESLELVNLDAADQGDYTFFVANDIGKAVSQPARLTIGAPRNLRDWTIAHVGELVNLTSRGEPEASWAGDGVSNLMKWAMGLPLTESLSGHLTSGDYAEGGLQIQFLRNAAAGDVMLIVERSETLAEDSWEPIARHLADGWWETLVPAASVSEVGLYEVKTVTVSDDLDGDQGFLRVRVLQTE